MHIDLAAPFLGASTLMFLKPRLKAIVRPLAAKLADLGITANQVTLASLASSIAFLITLILMVEIAGIAGPLLGSDRRLEGPLGKADRSINLAALGFVIVTFGGLPDSAQLLPPLLYGGLVLTIWNRLRFAVADEGKTSG